MNNNSIQQAALDYCARGWKVIVLRERSKLPVSKAWVTKTLTPDEIQTSFKAESNIGIQLGSVSGNLADVDLDSREARALTTLLPPTGATFGRNSTGVTHALFIVRGTLKTERLLGPDGATICEIRFDRAQTMVPPSVHPEGEIVEWINSGDPGDIDAGDLQQAVRELSAAALLVAAWAKGSRHECSLIAGACFARAGISKERAVEIMEAICEAASDDETPSRVGNLNDSYERVAKNEPAYGLPELAKHIGETAAALVGRYLGLRRDTARAPKHDEASKRITSSLTLWVTPDDISHATFEVDGHRENVKLRSRRFQKHLIRQIRANGLKPLTTNALEQYIDGLDAEAQAGPIHETALRVAAHDGDIYLDLVDERWRAIRITSDGWSIVDNPPVRFLRTPGMRPLPLPVPGDISALRPFVNVSSDEDFVLFVSALVGALFPGAPHVILMISGEQGTAKTTLGNVFKSLVDPNIAPVRTLPRSEQELFIMARNSWLLGFDNVSFIPSNIADALCRIASGGAFSARALYSDDEEVVLEARRPVEINGIPSLAQRPDLLDRSILLTLPVIEPEHRKPEKQFKSEFVAEAPAIMGAICTALSSALRNYTTVDLPNPPRMADFARVVTAAEEGLGWARGTFMAAYKANQEAALTDLASQDPLIEVIRRCLSKSGGEIKHTATELLNVLTASATYNETRLRSFPKQPNQLTRQLRRLAPVMRSMGIDVDLDYERDQTTHVKTIRLHSTVSTEEPM